MIPNSENEVPVLVSIFSTFFTPFKLKGEVGAEKRKSFVPLPFVHIRFSGDGGEPPDQLLVTLACGSRRPSKVRGFRGGVCTIKLVRKNARYARQREMYPVLPFPSEAPPRRAVESITSDSTSNSSACVEFIVRYQSYRSKSGRFKMQIYNLQKISHTREIIF